MMYAVLLLLFAIAIYIITFFFSGEQLALQMDALEQYLKIEKMDPAEIGDDSIKHKQEKWNTMSNSYTDVESSGKKVIDQVVQVCVIPYVVFIVHKTLFSSVCILNVVHCLEIDTLYRHGTCTFVFHGLVIPL